LLAGIAAYAAPISPVDAASPARRCEAAKTYVVVETPTVRVDFVLRHGLRRYSYCVLRTGQRRLLVADNVFESVADIRVTLRYVGWVDVSCDSSGAPCVRSGITVRELRNPKNTATLRVEGPVDEWVLGADGAAAWTGRSGIPTVSGQGYVAIWDRHTTTRLARSPDVDPTSLALANRGRRIFWIEAGQPASHTL
jgi:hypothetical protein